jgi:S-adenosylmethionine hydrolase
MGCITLLTDFGLQDATVASVKGRLMQLAPGCPMIDISHLTEPFHLQQAAYILNAAYKDFPQGTCHLILFDIFSEEHPKLVLCEKDGHYFLAPDNGIISLTLGKDVASWLCYEMQHEDYFKDWVMNAGKIVNALQATTAEKLNLQPYKLQNAPMHWEPNFSNNVLECQIIHIDRFENVIINITQEQFETLRNGRTFRIRFMRDEEITEMASHYYDVREGEKLCRFNSTGYMEIAINRGKAASLFGLKLYREHHLMYNTIKIYFE